MRSPDAGQRAVRRRLILSTLLVPVVMAGTLDARAPRAASAAATSASAARTLSTSWKQVRSAHFVMAGNGSDNELRQAATEMESFRQVLQQMFPSLRLTSPAPTRIILFGDDGSFARFQPADRSGRRVGTVVGYFMPLPDTNYIIANVHGGRAFSLDVLFHEYTHYVLDQNAHSVPLWFNEGVADYYSTFRLDPATGLRVVGTPPASRLSWLRRSALLPLEKMLSSHGAARLLQDQQDRATFYAESWALVHYLTLGDDGRRQGQMDAYLENLDRGLPIGEAFRAAFNCTYRQMEQELRRYIGSARLPALTVRTDTDAPPAVRPVTAMTEVDARAMLADVLVRLHAREADEAIAGALAREPANRQARLSLALLRLQQQREGDAVDLLEALAREDGGDYAVQLNLVAALMEARRYDEATDAAERAAALNCESPTAWFRIAEAAEAAGREKQADEAMARAQRLRPNPDRYRERAYDLFRLGLNAAAARDARAFLDRTGWGNEQTPRVALLMAVAERRLGQFADADTLLERVRTVVESGSWMESLVLYLQAQLTAPQLLSMAREPAEKTEAHTYIALEADLAGHCQEALSHLHWVRDQGNTTSTEYALALGALKRLETTTAGSAR